MAMVLVMAGCRRLVVSFLVFVPEFLVPPLVRFWPKFEVSVVAIDFVPPSVQVVRDVAEMVMVQSRSFRVNVGSVMVVTAFSLWSHAELVVCLFRVCW